MIKNSMSSYWKTSTYVVHRDSGFECINIVSYILKVVLFNKNFKSNTSKHTALQKLVVATAGSALGFVEECDLLHIPLLSIFINERKSEKRAVRKRLTKHRK